MENTQSATQLATLDRTNIYAGPGVESAEASIKAQVAKRTEKVLFSHAKTDTPHVDLKQKKEQESKQLLQNPAEDIRRFVELHGNDFFEYEAYKSRTERHNIGFEKITRDIDGNILSRERLPPDTIEKFEQQTSNDTNTSIEYTGVNDCKNVSQEFAQIIGNNFPDSKIEVATFIYQDQLDDDEMYHSIIVVTNPDNSQQFIDITHKQIDLKSPVATGNISSFADYYPGLVDYYADRKDWNEIFISREEMSQPKKSLDSFNRKTSSGEVAKSEKPTTEVPKTPDAPLPPWKNPDVPRGAQAFYDHLLEDIKDGKTDVWDRINTSASSQYDPVLIERFKQYAYDQGVRPGILDQDDIDRRNGLRAEEAQHQKTEARRIGRVAKGLISRAFGKQPEPIPPGRGATILKSEEQTNKNWSPQTEAEFNEKARTANEVVDDSSFPSQDIYHDLRGRPSFQTVPGSAPPVIPKSESQSQPRQEQPMEQKPGDGKPGYFADLLGLGSDESTPAPHGYDWWGNPRTEPVQPEPESSVPEGMQYNPWNFSEPVFVPQDQPTTESYSGPVDYWGYPAKQESSESTQDSEPYRDPMDGIAEFFGFDRNTTTGEEKTEHMNDWWKSTADALGFGPDEKIDPESIDPELSESQENAQTKEKSKGGLGFGQYQRQNYEEDEKTDKSAPKTEKPRREYKFPGFGRKTEEGQSKTPDVNPEPGVNPEKNPSGGDGKGISDPDTDTDKDWQRPTPFVQPTNIVEDEDGPIIERANDEGPDAWRMQDPLEGPGPIAEIESKPPIPVFEGPSDLWHYLQEKGEENGYFTKPEYDAYTALNEGRQTGVMSEEGGKAISHYFETLITPNPAEDQIAIPVSEVFSTNTQSPTTSDTTPEVSSTPAVDATSPAEN